MSEQLLIAHRGVMQHYPENTLPAFLAAASAGANAVELDIQMSADGVPMVIHDPTLLRTCGIAGEVSTMRAQQLVEFSAHAPTEFGERFAPNPISTLATVIEALNTTPITRLFVELKRQSLASSGTEAMIAATLQVTASARFEITLISYIAEAIASARAQGCQSTGWVLRHYDAEHKDIASRLQPDFLFVDYLMLTPPLWPGPWQWVAFDVVDTNTAQRLLQMGIEHIESADPARLAALFGRGADDE
jgi:glycerophosphoryl diester phosphodiesterase